MHGAVVRRRRAEEPGWSNRTFAGHRRSTSVHCCARRRGGVESVLEILRADRRGRRRICSAPRRPAPRGGPAPPAVQPTGVRRCLEARSARVRSAPQRRSRRVAGPAARRGGERRPAGRTGGPRGIGERATSGRAGGSRAATGASDGGRRRVGEDWRRCREAAATPRRLVEGARGRGAARRRRERGDPPPGRPSVGPGRLPARGGNAATRTPRYTGRRRPLDSGLRQRDAGERARSAGLEPAAARPAGRGGADRARDHRVGQNTTSATSSAAPRVRRASTAAGRFARAVGREADPCDAPVRDRQTAPSRSTAERARGRASGDGGGRSRTGPPSWGTALLAGRGPLGTVLDTRRRSGRECREGRRLRLVQPRSFSPAGAAPGDESRGDYWARSRFRYPTRPLGRRNKNRLPRWSASSSSPPACPESRSERAGRAAERRAMRPAAASKLLRVSSPTRASKVPRPFQRAVAQSPAGTLAFALCDRVAAHADGHVVETNARAVLALGARHPPLRRCRLPSSAERRARWTRESRACCRGAKPAGRAAHPPAVSPKACRGPSGRASRRARVGGHGRETAGGLSRRRHRRHLQTSSPRLGSLGERPPRCRRERRDASSRRARVAIRDIEPVVAPIGSAAPGRSARTVAAAGASSSPRRSSHVDGPRLRSLRGTGPRPRPAPTGRRRRRREGGRAPPACAGRPRRAAARPLPTPSAASIASALRRALSPVYPPATPAGDAMPRGSDRRRKVDGARGRARAAVRGDRRASPPMPRRRRRPAIRRPAAA